MNLNSDDGFSLSTLQVLALFGAIALVSLLIFKAVLPKDEQAKNASLQDRVLNHFQAWALENPDQILSKTFLPLISLIEGLIANIPTYLDGKRLIFGPNFCCAGQVVMGEFKTLETALTSPQARTWRLGTTILDADNSPNQDINGRNVFLLSLSDKAASGNSDHDSFRACLQDYLITKAATERQKDEVAERLLVQLATDYSEMSHGRGGEFFSDPQRGLMGFMVRYLHYVLFGLDPDDKGAIDLLTDLHYQRKGTLHYFGVIGSFLKTLNLMKHGDLPDLIEKAAQIYANSPALKDFKEGSPHYNGMTRYELAKMMTGIMSIAALQGPLHLAYTAMGYSPLPAYTGRKTSEIDPTQHWDKLNLNDRDAVQRFLLECGRLWAPVSATHRVATESFTVRVAGKERTFPVGTKILIPLSFGLLDESFWGPSTYEFNENRENLCPFHMGFHSVGDRHNGRICPGREIALDMLVDILITVGRKRH